MAHQRRQLEQLREELPSNPVMLLTTDQDLSAPTKGFSSTLCKAFCTLLMGRDKLQLYSTPREVWDVPGGCFSIPVYKPQM